jgi:hypothetical protein
MQLVDLNTPVPQTRNVTNTISIYSEKDLAFENLEQEKSTFEEKDAVQQEDCMLLYTCE